MPGIYYLVLIWTKHCKTIVSPQKNDNFYFCTRRKQLHFSVLFRKIQNILYVGVLNDCSKFWLGGQVAAICFPAVWWKFCLWIWCRWAVRKLQRFVSLQILTGHKLCTLALPSHFSASWVTRFAMLQMGCPSLLFCQADKTSAEKCQRGPGTQSSESILEECHTVLIHLVSLDMAHMRQLAESFAAASRLLHHVWNMQSYWSASGGRVQLSSELREWSPCMMSFGSWKVIHSERHAFPAAFLRQRHSSCRGQRGPEVECLSV